MTRRDMVGTDAGSEAVARAQGDPRHSRRRRRTCWRLPSAYPQNFAGRPKNSVVAGISSVVWEAAVQGELCPQIGSVAGCSTPYRVWPAGFLHFRQKKSLAGSRPLLVSGAGLLLGLVPATQEVLCRPLVALLHVAHACDVVVILVSVAERARLASFLKQAQTVGALMAARVAGTMDRVAAVCLGGDLMPPLVALGTGRLTPQSRPVFVSRGAVVICAIRRSAHSNA